MIFFMITQFFTEDIQIFSFIKSKRKIVNVVDKLRLKCDIFFCYDKFYNSLNFIKITLFSNKID